MTIVARAGTSTRIAPTSVRSVRSRRPVPRESTPLSVVHLAAECAPFVRTGGLGEAVRTLGDTQAAAGMRVSIILPLYGVVRAAQRELHPVTEPFTIRIGLRDESVRLFAALTRIGEPSIYFVDHPMFSRRSGIYGEGGVDYADSAYRFAVFSRAALAALPNIAPSTAVIHAHDWHAALAPVYLRTAPYGRAARGLATVLSVHNAGFQGHYPPEMMRELGLSWELYDWRRFEWHGRMNILKGGLAFADVVTTVSPSHAIAATYSAHALGGKSVCKAASHAPSASPSARIYRCSRSVRVSSRRRDWTLFFRATCSTERTLSSYSSAKEIRAMSPSSPRGLQTPPTQSRRDSPSGSRSSTSCSRVQTRA